MRDIRFRAAMVLFLSVAAGAVFLAVGSPPPSRDEVVADKWTCSMDPQFVFPEPGKCPKCFMDLIPLEGGFFGGGNRELILPYAAADAAGITTDMAEQEETDEGTRITIPAAAVLYNLGRSFVYLEADDGESLSYTLHEITVGGREGDRVIVADGLEGWESLAASGLYRIDSTMQILGKVSLVNLPDGDLALADEDVLPPYQPAERSAVDLRAYAAHLDDWFSTYEALRASLAQDDSTASGSSARRLAQYLSEPDECGEATDLIASLTRKVQALAGAGDLESRRTAFESVTGDMVLLARRYGAPDPGLNLVYCPMAFGGSGAYWLQPQDTVDNPYHGLEMPLCGWLVDSIPPLEKTD